MEVQEPKGRFLPKAKLVGVEQPAEIIAVDDDISVNNFGSNVYGMSVATNIPGEAENHWRIEIYNSQSWELAKAFGKDTSTWIGKIVTLRVESKDGKNYLHILPKV